MNIGTYDLLHRGHLFVFQQMRELAAPLGEVVVGVNSDDFVSRFKGHPPVQTYSERVAMLSAVRNIDRVVPNVGGEDSRPIIDQIEPDIIAVGQDWYSPDDSRYCAQMGFTKEWLAERGIRLVYLDWMTGYSSTNLRATARAMDR